MNEEEAMQQMTLELPESRIPCTRAGARRRRWWILLLLGLAFPAAANADLRTKGIRLVPTTVWKATPGPITVTGEAKTNAPKVAELMPLLDKWIEKAFTDLGYKVSDKAPLTFSYTVDEFDFGKQWKRMVGGFWGQAFIRGTIVLRQGKKEVGRYQFSSKPTGGISAGSLNSMAKEVGPPLILKLTKGESDKALHEHGGK